MRGDGQRSGGLRARRALSLPPGAGMRGERFLERWTAPGSGFEAQSGPRATPWGFKCPTALSRGGVGGMGGQEAMGVVGTRGFCARFLNSERRKPSVAAHPRTPRWELGAGRGGVLVGAAARWFPAGRDLPAPGAGRGSGWVGVSGYGGLRCPSARLPSPRTMNIHRAPSPSPRRFLLTVFHPFSPTFNPPPPGSRTSPAPRCLLSFISPYEHACPRPAAGHTRDIPLPRPTAARGGSQRPLLCLCPAHARGGGAGPAPSGIGPGMEQSRPPPPPASPRGTPLGSSPRSGPVPGSGEIVELLRAPQPAPHPRCASRAALPALSKGPVSPPPTLRNDPSAPTQNGEGPPSWTEAAPSSALGSFRRCFPRCGSTPRSDVAAPGGATRVPAAPEHPPLPGKGGWRGGGELSAGRFFSVRHLGISFVRMVASRYRRCCSSLLHPIGCPCPKLGCMFLCGGHPAACCNGVIFVSKWLVCF